MAENIPPSTTAATSSTTPATNGITTNTSNHGGIMTANGIVGGSDSNNRGLPYYEKLRRELRDLLTRKPVHDKNLSTIESSIYTFETSYLEETTAGNIIRGFDNYIKGASASSISASDGPNRRRAPVNESDRIFSKSSVDSAALKDEMATSTPNSAVTTPGANGRGGTPSAANVKENGAASGSVKGAAGGGSKNSKKRAAVKEEDEGTDSGTGTGTGKNSKRQKVSFSRGGGGGGD